MPYLDEQIPREDALRSSLVKRQENSLESTKSNLRVLKGIFLKDLKYFVRSPGRLILMFVLPYLLTIAVEAVGKFMGGARSAASFAQTTGTSNVFEYQVLGASMWIVSWMTLDRIGTTLRDERIAGTLEQSYLAPINRFLILAGMSLVLFITNTIAFFGVVVLSIVSVDGSAAIGLGPAFLVLAFSTLPLFGISFVIAGVMVRFKEPGGFISIVNLLMAILMGVYYPVSILPSWAQLASKFLPQTWALQAMRMILLSKISLSVLLPNYIALAAMAVVYPIIGYSVFKLYLDKAAVSGDLSKF